MQCDTKPFNVRKRRLLHPAMLFCSHMHNIMPSKCRLNKARRTSSQAEHQARKHMLNPKCKKSRRYTNSIHRAYLHKVDSLAVPSTANAYIGHSVSLQMPHLHTELDKSMCAFHSPNVCPRTPVQHQTINCAMTSPTGPFK